MADTMSSTRRAALWMGIATVFSPCLAQADVPPQVRMRAEWDAASIEERSFLVRDILIMEPQSKDELVLQAEVMEYMFEHDKHHCFYGYRMVVQNILTLAKSGVLA
jgi:hypothetical protein